MASSDYVCAIFAIVLNKKHEHKNIMGLGRFHKKGYETYESNRNKYIRSVIKSFKDYDDIDHIIPLTTVPTEKYRAFIEFYFTKNLRYYSIDVQHERIAFEKPDGWFE